MSVIEGECDAPTTQASGKAVYLLVQPAFSDDPEDDDEQLFLSYST